MNVKAAIYSKAMLVLATCIFISIAIAASLPVIAATAFTSEGESK